ncbi:sensor histidine kinase [Psychromonas marina]|uniref:histidine kinase n=1 Tax=Psychromonas marina TaxID=88364 RepID=A0ABQ6DWT3_9GAMM|nr:ATP-binding protein [Psychromonas marina]GLS89579.1 sensor histidine kinase [Psychromonas marina]
MQWKSTNSLFAKIFAAFWLLIALLISALILLPQLDSRQLQPIKTAGSELILYQSSKLTSLLDKNPLLGSRSILRLLANNNDSDQHTEVFLTDTTGHLINATAPRKIRQFMLDSQSPQKPLQKINTYKTYYGPRLLVHNQHEYLIYISTPNQKKSLELVEWLLDNPLLLIFTGILVTMPICAFFAWHLTLPLRQLRIISTKVARGELDIPFPEIKNSDEFTMLAKSMQLMVRSLKNMLNNQQRLLSDISHELRSPLTRLTLAVAITKKHTGDTKELQRIELEAERMEQMIAEMLNLSQIQLHQAKKEDLALDDFLEDLFLDAQFEANEYSKTFSYPTLSKVSINIYPELAYRAIENIIRNAIKYAKQQISVKIHITPHTITLTISNDGPLIPEKELDNIFRPFYRLNESRERETGGAGLGLSIAENAIFKHGGKIWADNLGNQVSMHLQFPRFN